MLDSEEYLHLAIHASQNNAHHAALEYLHQCLELEPENARAIFLLAAEHAELGLMDRAIAGMERTLSLDPGIEMAAYQLGLLYIQKGQLDESFNMWTQLSESPNDTPLRLFAQGMVKLEEDKDLALQMMKRAAETQMGNPALQNSMLNVLNQFSVDVEHQPQATAKGQDELFNALYLNAYKTSTFDTEEND